MTPAQKTDDVIKTVKEARKNYSNRSEFVAMVNIIWDALDGADAIAEPDELQRDLDLARASGAVE